MRGFPGSSGAWESVDPKDPKLVLIDN
jgi:hypothetical protein